MESDQPGTASYETDQAASLLSDDELIGSFRRIMKADLNAKIFTMPQNLDQAYQNLKELDLAGSAIQANITSWEKQQVILQNLLGEGFPVDPSLNPTRYLVTERIESLTSMQAKLYAIQKYLREEVNRLSRPYVRPLVLLDIPDEILAKICVFAHARPYTDKEKKYASDNFIVPEEIRNLRLTCQRLCNASSNLLISTLSVSVEMASLDRLEMISQHPTISKGIRCIQINPKYYVKILADSLSSFAGLHAQKLRSEKHLLGNPVNWNTDIVSFEDIHRYWQKVDSISNCWLTISGGGSISSRGLEALMYGNLLAEAHSEYERRYKAQKQLLDGGEFVRRVAAAFVRMPTTQALRIIEPESSEYDRISIREKMNSDALLLLSLSMPLTWHYPHGEPDLAPPPELFPGLFVCLPIAIHKAGCTIKQLKYEVILPDDCTSFVIGSEERCDLNLAVRSLKTFTFMPIQFCHGAEQPQSGVEALGSFISPFLDTDNLQNISLDLSFLRENDPLGEPQHSIGSVLSKHNWPKLENLRIVGMPVHLTEFQQFIEGLRKPLASFDLWALHLISGSWVDALDVMKRAGLRQISFEVPTGGEGEHPYAWPHDIDLSKVIEKVNSWIEDAEEYIRGQRDENPLKALLEELGHDSW